MTTLPYTADSIQVRHDLEFPFEKLERLCVTYKSFTYENVKRLLEAALIVDEPWDIVEQRFLQGRRDIDVSPEYRAAYAELVDIAHNTARTR